MALGRGKASAEAHGVGTGRGHLAYLTHTAGLWINSYYLVVVVRLNGLRGPKKDGPAQLVQEGSGAEAFGGGA